MIDHKDRCLECKKEIDIEELAEFDGWCFDCYKKEREREGFGEDPFEKDQEKADYNGLL